MHRKVIRLLALPCLLLGGGLLPAQSYRDLAKEAALKGDNEEAVLNYELALKSAMKVFAEDDLEIVIRRGELGEAYRAVGRWDDAISQLDYAWKRARFDAETKSRWSAMEGDLAMRFAESLGRSCQAAARYPDAVMVFSTAISDAERTLRPEEDTIVYCALLADTLLLLKRDDEAAKYASRGEQLARQLHDGETNPQALARILSSFAMLYHRQLRHDRALPLAEETLVLALRGASGKPEEIAAEIATYKGQLGGIMLHVPGRLDEAEALLLKARESLLAALTSDAAELMPVSLSLSQVSLLRGKFDAAQTHAGEAWRLCKLHYPEDHPEAGRCFRQLGDNFVALGISDNARDLYAQALAIFETSFGKDHPLTEDTRQRLEKLKADATAEAGRRAAAEESKEQKEAGSSGGPPPQGKK